MAMTSQIQVSRERSRGLLQNASLQFSRPGYAKTDKCEGYGFRRKRPPLHNEHKKPLAMARGFLGEGAGVKPASVKLLVISAAPAAAGWLPGRPDCHWQPAAPDRSSAG